MLRTLCIYMWRVVHCNPLLYFWWLKFLAAVVIAPVTKVIVIIFLSFFLSFFLFLVSLGKVLSILLIFSKNWLFVSLICFIVFNFIDLWSDLGISFLLLAWINFVFLKFFLVSRGGSLFY